MPGLSTFQELFTWLLPTKNGDKQQGAESNPHCTSLIDLFMHWGPYTLDFLYVAAIKVRFLLPFFSEHRIYILQIIF